MLRGRGIVHLMRWHQRWKNWKSLCCSRRGSFARALPVLVRGADRRWRNICDVEREKQKIEVISTPRRPLCTDLLVRCVIFEWNESEEWQVEARRRFCEAVETRDRVFRLQSFRTLVWISDVPAKDRGKSVEQELRTAGTMWTFAAASKHWMRKNNSNTGTCRARNVSSLGQESLLCERQLTSSLSGCTERAR